MNVNMERFSVNLEEKNVNRGENTDVKYFNTRGSSTATWRGPAYTGTGGRWR